MRRRWVEAEPTSAGILEADNVGDGLQVTTPMAWYGVMVVEVWGAGAYLRGATRLRGRTLIFRWVADAQTKPLAFLGKSVSKGEGKGDTKTYLWWWPSTD